MSEDTQIAQALHIIDDSLLLENEIIKWFDWIYERLKVELFLHYNEVSGYIKEYMCSYKFLVN
jgi:hypothetical protein